MTEIEKMFENAGVEPIDFKLEPMGTLKFSVDDIGNTWTREQYMREVPIYPPFTAEKQIAVLKLLTQQCDLTISHFTEWEFIHFDGQEPTQVVGKDFVETFAKLINAYWQDLADQEKEEIRRILNE